MYSMLISKAGKAKDVDSALSLHQQMLDSHLQPTQVGRQAALFVVCGVGSAVVAWAPRHHLRQPPSMRTVTALCQAAAASLPGLLQAATRLQAGLSCEHVAVIVSAVCRRPA